ncbi:hypothetical protein BST81_05810 [Leptolyngbya sp. 'hensonii']|uniref:hypothetical protein n=1 Tax=Leptolyngbya sp. 'hensonii' TaxID=1922337 RepID=UPI00095022F0|nr:hypothetical protein [Leptolyngbya sp. 'hensonii']OLP19273.1 hypothetical protein BST81_05810 [Leptolyngbya sp. 'hensonii']
MAQLNLLPMAKQGDPEAIADLINRVLQPKGISARAELRGQALHIVLEAAQVPDQESLSNFIQLGMLKLEPGPVEVLFIYGRQTSNHTPQWCRRMPLRKEPHSPHLCNSAMKMSSIEPGESMVRSTPSSIESADEVSERPLNSDRGQPIYKRVRKKKRVRQVVKEANRRMLIRHLLTGLALTVLGFGAAASAISLIDWVLVHSNAPSSQPIGK